MLEWTMYNLWRPLCLPCNTKRITWGKSSHVSFKSVRLWKDCKESPLTSKAFSNNWSGKNPLRCTPHRKVNSPCKSSTSVVRQRWSDIVNRKKFEKENGNRYMERRSGDAAEDEIDCVWLSILAATQSSSSSSQRAFWTRTTSLSRTFRRAKSAVRFIQPSRNCLSCRWLIVELRICMQLWTECDLT